MSGSNTDICAWLQSLRQSDDLFKRRVCPRISTYHWRSGDEAASGLRITFHDGCGLIRDTGAIRIEGSIDLRA